MKMNNQDKINVRTQDLFSDLMRDPTGLSLRIKQAELEMFKEYTCDGPINVPEEFKWDYVFTNDSGEIITAQPTRLYLRTIYCKDQDGNKYRIQSDNWIPMQTAILIDNVMDYIKEQNAKQAEINAKRYN